MMQVLDLRGKTGEALSDFLASRRTGADRSVVEAVESIIEEVRQRGDEALFAFTERFDGCIPEKPCMERDEIEAAAKTADPAFVAALERARENIAAFHQKQVRQGFEIRKGEDILLGQMVRPLQRVGLYVPGGTAAYPSSVLMNAIPARIAGVPEIIMVTPPGKGGAANPDILAAAAVAGVDKICFFGGAQAVAALSFGTKTVPRVDKIVGPGNIYVAVAKQLLFGTVDIDMIAGPSEIAIVADKTANPRFLAADMMSQAEHDVLASSVLLTPDEALIGQVKEELARQMPLLSRREIIEKSLKNHGMMVLCDDIPHAFSLVNEIAPEHLEIVTSDPRKDLALVRNAGSVFLGEYAPEPLGDYYAGPNHVLPTNSTARFFSPLSVDSFIKKTSFIQYSKKALEAAREDVSLIAQREGLTAHRNSVEVRFL